MALVEIREVTKSFQRDAERIDVFTGLTMDIEQGTFTALMGPSGSGKSTLLNVLGLLDRPSAGVYELDGRDVGRLPDRDRAGLRAERLGFVFQAFHLLAHRSALENVMFGGMYQGVPKQERRRRAIAALDRVGLLPRASSRPDHLSGGERQRVAVARALVVQPSVLLCDEPTGNLDSATTASLLDLFDELVGGGLTMCVITHDRDVAARAHRQVRIVDGTLTEVGPDVTVGAVDQRSARPSPAPA
jgi:putative ABC transport system ATP-binding protein